MRDVERSERLPAQRTVSDGNRMALYDQYGSIAYGIILRILNEPELAQQVLVNLFVSLQLTESSVSTGVIIRLARQMALDARPVEAQSVDELVAQEEVTPSHLPMLIFDLAFCRGYSLQTVAERLQLTYADAAKAIRSHFVNFKNYHQHQR